MVLSWWQNHVRSFFSGTWNLREGSWRVLAQPQIWEFAINQGPHFGSPYNKDHNVFGSILGPPIYGSPHLRSGLFGPWLPPSDLPPG